MADYHSLLMRAVANLPNAGTPATRGAIYGRARKALLEQLRSLRPPLPESDITREENALDAAIAEIEERYGSQEPALRPPAAPRPRRPRPAGRPGSAPAESGAARPPQFSTRPAPQRAVRAAGPTAPSARSPSQAGRQVQPGPQPRPSGAAQRPSPPAPAGAVQPAATPAASADRRLPAGRPRRRRRSASPARSQLAAAMANQPSPSRREPAERLLRSEREAAEDERICREWRRSTRAGRSGRARPTTRTRPTRRQLSRAVPTKPCNRPRRRKWRPSSTDPASASRPEAEIQRPVAPGVEVAKPKRLLLDRGGGRSWRRPRGGGRRDPDASEAAGPRHQAPVETQQPASPEPSAKIAERVADQPAASCRACACRERAASGPADRSRLPRRRVRRPERRASRRSRRQRRRRAGRRC